MSELSTIRFLAVADEERRLLPVEERAAMNAAIEKLRVTGARLPFPHQSPGEGRDKSSRAPATCWAKPLAGFLSSGRAHHVRHCRYRPGGHG
jgi:hypothetical protein